MKILISLLAVIVLASCSLFDVDDDHYVDTREATFLARVVSDRVDNCLLNITFRDTPDTFRYAWTVSQGIGICETINYHFIGTNGVDDTLLEEIALTGRPERYTFLLVKDFVAFKIFGNGKLLAVAEEGLIWRTE